MKVRTVSELLEGSTGNKNNQSFQGTKTKETMVNRNSIEFMILSEKNTSLNASSS